MRVTRKNKNQAIERDRESTYNFCVEKNMD